jgi:hypothetical protein
MDAFWTRLHSPDAIAMVAIAAVFLAYFARTGYVAYRTTSGRVVKARRAKGCGGSSSWESAYWR